MLRTLGLIVYVLFLFTAPAFAVESWRHYLPPQWLVAVEVSDLPDAEQALGDLFQRRGFKVRGLGATLHTLIGANIDFQRGPLVAGVASIENRSAPFALLPCEDFVKFAKSVGGEQTGRVALFSLSGYEFTLVDAGPWVFVTATSDQQLAPPEQIPVQDQVASNEGEPGLIALHWSPAGWRELLELSAGAKDERAAQQLIRLGRVGTPKSLTDALSWIAAHRTWLARLEPTVSTGSLAIISPAPDLWKVELTLAGGETAGTAHFRPTLPLPDLAAERPAIATLSSNHAPASLEVDAILALIESRPDQLEVRKFEPVTFARFAAEARSLTKQLRAYRWELRTRRPPEPLACNQLLVLDVHSQEKFLSDLEAMVVLWNAALAEAKAEPGTQLKVSPLDIIGFPPGRTFSIDMVAAIGGPRIPEVVVIMEQFFGPNGVQAFRVLPLDDHRVVVSDWPEADFEELVKQLAKAPVGLLSETISEPVSGRLRFDRYTAWTNQMENATLADALGRKALREVPGPVDLSLVYEPRPKGARLSAEVSSAGLDVLLEYLSN